MARSAPGASLSAVCRSLGLAASLRRILCFARLEGYWLPALGFQESRSARRCLSVFCVLCSDTDPTLHFIRPERPARLGARRGTVVARSGPRALALGGGKVDDRNIHKVSK